jgi:uncharacterized protein (DUF427 family)
MNRSEALEDKVLVSDSDRSLGQLAMRIEKSDRRVRAYLAGELVVDSKNVLLVFEPRRLPVYYFPAENVRMDLLKPTRHTVDSAGTSETLRWDLEVGDRKAENAAWGYREATGDRAPLHDHVAFYWSKLDAWFEEDDEVFVHPRDPYHRVDVVNSSRNVKVVVEGQVVAETSRPRLLFETSLPTRYYIPKLDVNMALVEPTETVTACPYKGQAHYWSVRVGDRVLKDLIWSYPTAIAECPKIENLFSFYNEKVDLYVDGELQPRPITPWS